MQAKVPSKTAPTKEAKRKQHQNVSNYLEGNDCSREGEKVYFRAKFPRSQHQFL